MNTLIQPPHSRLKKNNFDLLRLAFALTVCIVHAYQLSGLQQLHWLNDILSSYIAVKSFFVVSGFLIFMSFERSSTLKSYFMKRLRRIYPAYIAIIFMCALGLAFISEKSLTDFFSYAWLKYLTFNLLFLNFLQPTLPGTFEQNPLSAVNGALWTLKIEVMFYLFVPMIVWLCRQFSYLLTLSALYILSITYVILMSFLAEQHGSSLYLTLAYQLPGQLSYFMAGALLYYFLANFERHYIYFISVATAILSINHFYALPFLEPLALAILVVFFGLFLYLGDFGKYGDFSYGIYIMHFPIIQIFIHMNWLQTQPYLYLCSVILLTISGSILMWHAVEKPFLRQKSHYMMPHRKRE